MSETIDDHVEFSALKMLADAYREHLTIEKQWVYLMPRTGFGLVKKGFATEQPGADTADGIVRYRVTYEGLRYMNNHAASEDDVYDAEWEADYERSMEDDNDIPAPEPDELAALRERVKVLTRALTPFALACNDVDIQRAADSDPLEITRRVDKLDARLHSISIIIDYNADAQEELKVGHLRAAAEALKGSGS